ncbi:hypothetical protein SNOG_03930 [Parastagonospora nodorum SN15]|uniref:Uncharacterized protein n=1 Tax=Phaeosphaeria nodorum (strain SN15 / ATCC MYA-4574 / FGSC 10173) TaxID=321614 RepID=Q0UWD4_PHANO|nr:hypothetical protein SNOG_03930 [Parastagonospora nodorum SN15]EAT89135.1 hypothetical protein SNOG_03930 [Parastagonospora nodorum SN15]
MTLDPTASRGSTSEQNTAGQFFSAASSRRVRLGVRQSFLLHKHKLFVGVTHQLPSCRERLRHASNPRHDWPAAFTSSSLNWGEHLRQRTLTLYLTSRPSKKQYPVSSQFGYPCFRGR